MTPEEYQKIIDSSTRNIIDANYHMGHLCVFVRSDEKGAAVVLAPAIHPKDIAEMLYKAADMYADYASGSLPPDQITTVRQ